MPGGEGCPAIFIWQKTAKNEKKFEKSDFFSLGGVDIFRRLDKMGPNDNADTQKRSRQMTKFSIFQINLTDAEYHMINSDAFQKLESMDKELREFFLENAADSKLGQVYNRFTAYRRAMLGSKLEGPFNDEHHEFVAHVDAEDLEDVFHITNLCGEYQELEAKITRYASMHSLSVGDVVVDEQGNKFLCDSFGFTAI